MKELHDARRELAKWLNEEPNRPIDRVALATVLWAIDAPEPYDQQALGLCEKCGWKTLIPGDGCLNCDRVRELSDAELLTMWRASVARAYKEDDGEAHEFFYRAVLAAQRGDA